MPIHHTFAPHVDAVYAFRTFGLLLRPWLWRSGTGEELLAAELRRRFGWEPILFSSGREALCSCLRALPIGSGDEVIVQGYTCIVVPNAIHAAGGSVIYADVSLETLNLDPEAVREAITPRTRAVICQHTFGIPADTEALRRICDEHRLLLIEDCAHVLPDATGPSDIGKQGDALLLSFGRDKAISGIAGGAIIVRDPAIAERLCEKQSDIQDLPLLTIARFLLYPLLYFLARPLYCIGIGKALLTAARLLSILPAIVTVEEKEGRMPSTLHRIPNPCALLARDGLMRLEAINDHRRTLTRLYLEASAAHGWPVLHGIRSDLPLQKYPMFRTNAESIRRALKHRNIHLDDGWTGCVICPASASEEKSGYTRGRDPHAEECAERILSLPTHPTMTITQARRLVAVLHDLLREESGKWKVESE